MNHYHYVCRMPFIYILNSSVEETSVDFILIITIDNNPYFTYLVDAYNSWKEAESAGKTLMA